MFSCVNLWLKKSYVRVFFVFVRGKKSNDKNSPDSNHRRQRNNRRRHERLGTMCISGTARTIGEECIVGEKTYIAYDVSIGNRVKINAMVYICAAVTIEDGVMISASGRRLPTTVSRARRCPISRVSEIERA